VKATHRSAVELEFLVNLFYDSLDDLGEFEEVDEHELPPPYSALLAHDQHMTETVEAYHGCPVDVRVLQSRLTATHYQRNSLLTRQSDARVVLFAIMRAALSLLAPAVREEIERAGTPLGRILVRRNVMRKVRLLSVWKVWPSARLCRHFAWTQPQTCYGRTALIYCDAVPVMELLEVVTSG
jgi:chorismate-pyruvate lyase